ncbi:hypothetical protein GALL_56420 [mine drainage metagenome]|uniref:Activator of Hsp90 ATPase homologue 1/2-like C-terminal domain-containing protein n=1 Tax=mine drainage metagenome TaxID=410659 RepID=A0A1J5SXJ2_9ZZZZ
MKTIYNINKEEKQITVERSFSASKDLVWDAYTKSEILEQWWAPNPYKAITKEMDFTEGGHWFYYMLSPAGEKHWCLVNYINIKPQDFFTAKDGFCDENKIVNPSFPSTYWENNFLDEKDSTKVITTLTFQSIEALEQLVSMGFKEGFAMAHENLDQLLLKIK